MSIKKVFNAPSQVSIYILKRWWLHLLIGGMSIFLVLLVHRKVYEQFYEDERYFINTDYLQVANPPEWLTDQTIASSIVASFKTELETSIFDKSLVTRLAEHLETNPWVTKIQVIEKRLPNQLRIKLDLRRPLVAVTENQRHHRRQIYYLVDKDLIRLPGEYTAVPNLPHQLPVVLGVRQTVPSPGQKWQDKGLEGALAVAETLNKHLTPQLYNQLGLAHIDVANINNRKDPRGSEIVLWTKNQVPIQWGRVPGTTKFGELSPEQKITNLKLVLEVSPKLKGLKYVKIQFHQPYIALK